MEVDESPQIDLINAQDEILINAEHSGEPAVKTPESPSANLKNHLLLLEESNHRQKTQEERPSQEDHASESGGAAADNGRTAESDGGALSPTSLRRSTRVSALKAQKRLRAKDGEMADVQQAMSVSPVPEYHGQNHHGHNQNHHNSATKESPAKTTKRKILKRTADAAELDQYDCKFGIRLDEDGDVLLMSDESEISSLNEEQVTDLRRRYENICKQEVAAEIREQRYAQIHELQLSLQHEEAVLAMLKKIRVNQQQAHFKLMQENVKRISGSVGQNNPGGGAYKPAVAVPSPAVNHHAKLNGTTAQTATSKSNKASQNRNQNSSMGGSMDFKLGSNVQQLLSMILTNPQMSAQAAKSLPPAMINQIIQLGIQQRQQQAAQQQQQHHSRDNSRQTQGSSAQQQRQTASQQHQRELKEQREEQQRQQAQQAATLARQQAQQEAQAQQAAALARQQAQQEAQAAAKAAAAAAEALAARVQEVQQNNAHRIAAARIQLRRHLEQQLILLPLPKAPAPELNFIPNANQPDFYAMLGLDLAVQRVQKDKAVFKKWDSEPYVCEQCATDFTPAWEAIEDGNGDYHLYCKQCVCQAQKRRIRAEHNTIFKCAFAKMKEQEKEFEKQLAAGKFTEPIPTTIPVTSTTATISTVQSSTSSTSTTSANASAAGRGTLSYHHHGAAAAAAASSASSMSGPTTGGSASASQSHHPHYTQQTSSGASASRGGGGAVNQSGGAASSSTPSGGSSSTAPQRGVNSSAAQNLQRKRTAATAANVSAGNGGSGPTSTSGAVSNTPKIANQLLTLLQNPNALNAMMSSPILAQNLQNLLSLMNNRNPQGGGNAGANPAAALSLLMHMQGGNASTGSTPTSSTSTSTNSGSSGSANRTSAGGGGMNRVGGPNSSNDVANAIANAINPMLALNTQLNAGAFMNNPQLLRHLHQTQAQQAAQQMFSANTKTSKK